MRARTCAQETGGKSWGESNGGISCGDSSVTLVFEAKDGKGANDANVPQLPTANLLFANAVMRCAEMANAGAGRTFGIGDHRSGHVFG